MDQATGVAVLGSTGSIGRQTLDVIRRLPGRLRVVALAGGSNHTLLEDQAREFKPDAVWCQDAARHMDLKAAATATPGTDDLYGSDKYIRNTPSCPSGGTYTIGNMATRPNCNIGTNGTGSADDHVLP